MVGRPHVVAGVVGRSRDKLHPVLGDAGVLEDLHRIIFSLHAASPFLQCLGHVELTSSRMAAGNLSLPVDGKERLWALAFRPCS